MLTADEARNIWRYNPDTGEFFWLVPAWGGKIPAGSPAGTISGDGAGRADRRVFLLKYRGQMYRAHRVAWLITIGKWPSNQIDHINGDPLDNRFCNLREATRHQNMHNTKKRAGTSRYKGVSKSFGKWKAQIRANGNPIHLGQFATEEEAHAAYCKAAKELHGEFARTS